LAQQDLTTGWATPQIRNFGVNRVSFLQAQSPSCHPTEIVNSTEWNSKNKCQSVTSGPNHFFNSEFW